MVLNSSSPCLLLLFCESSRGERAAQTHGFDGAAGDDDHGALFADGFIKHVHAAQMQRAGVVVVDAGGFCELL